MTAEEMTFADATGTTVLSMATVDDGMVAVVYAAGDLDMDTVPLFCRHVEETVRAYAPALLVVDLHELGFLGAAGISALLACLDVADREGGHLRLRRPSDPVRLALLASHTLDLFDVQDESEPSTWPEAGGSCRQQLTVAD